MAGTNDGPTQRFSSRVDYYVRFRPGYPPALISFLRDDLGFPPGSAVADIGSGTGKLSRLLLDEGYRVVGVEPNTEMRLAAESDLRGFDGFSSVAGSAEATGLGDGSVDHIVAAQAFHWFRVEETRSEFTRILRPGGRVVLIWNRRTESSPFLRDYEDLLQRLSLDYGKVDHRKTTDTGVLPRFFGTGGFRRTTFPYAQRLDREGLEGRALSSSYVPLPGQPNHGEMMEGLMEVFERHARDGSVSFDYETEVYWGRIEIGARRRPARYTE